MTPVLRWIKAHLVIVICGVVIIGAPLTAWFVSEGMNTELRDRISQGTSKLSELDRLRKSTVSLEVPGGTPISVTTVVNQKLLDAYERAVGQIGTEAQRVHEAGLSWNRDFNGTARSKDDIIRGMFPAPRESEKETLPFEMYEALINRYTQLLRDVGASGPPSPEEVSEVLSRRRDQFVAGQRKDDLSELDDSELDDLAKQLTQARLNVYRAFVLGESTLPGAPAAPVRFYATLGSLGLPLRPQSPPPMAELFDWQWRYWITQDFLFALADANGEKSALDGAVKRLVGMRISEINAERGSANSGGGGGGMGGGMAGGMSGMGGGGGQQPGRRRNTGNANAGNAAQGGGQPAAALGEPRIDPKREAKIDRAISITGRQSNEVYDVRTIDCELIVSTAQLPQLMDAIAKRNFMTVLNVTVSPADAFAAAKDGFIYGIEPVSKVNMQIETVWLREWTAQMMPGDLRDMLGIQSDPPKSANAQPGTDSPHSHDEVGVHG